MKKRKCRDEDKAEDITGAKKIGSPSYKFHGARLLAANVALFMNNEAL